MFSVQENDAQRPGKEGDMRFFEQLVSSGGLSPAARRMGVSISTVSKRLSALEERFGVALAVRNARGFALTEAGRYYYDQAAEINRAIDRAERNLEDLADSPKGSLRLGISEGIFDTLLAQPLVDFMHRHQGIEIVLLNLGQSASFVEDHLDCLILSGHPDEFPQGLDRVFVCQSDRVVCASPDYLKFHGRPGVPRDLREHHCLVAMNKRGKLLNNWRFRKGTRHESVSVRARFAALGWQVRRMAVAGMGIARIPDHVAQRCLARGELERVMEDWQDVETREISLLVRHEKHHSARVEALIEFFESHIGKPCGDFVEHDRIGVDRGAAGRR